LKGRAMMSKERQHDKIDRRTFLKVGSISTVAAAAGWSGRSAGESGEIHYRVLGRTGLKLSVVSLGAMRTFEPEVMQAAFDKGVNYIDTARCYKDGINERVIGMALKGRRDKVYVATKCHMVTPKEDIIKSVEESLRSLQTDYVDVLQLHHPSKADMLHEDAKAAMTQLREQGKVRFFGLSAHSNEVGILEGILADPDKFFDMALVVYNFKTKAELTKAIEQAARAGVGIVAMKTQAKSGYKTEELGDVSPHQAALKWVLQNPNVTAAVPAMVNLDQVKEDTAVMRMDLKLTRRDIDILRRYDLATALYYCYRCGECVATCPANVDIPTVNRSLMYAEGYGDLELARKTHGEIPREISASACADCSQCVAQCVNGVAISRQMRKAQALFA